MTKEELEKKLRKELSTKAHNNPLAYAPEHCYDATEWVNGLSAGLSRAIKVLEKYGILSLKK
jgi:hypothetical protein